MQLPLSQSIPVPTDQLVFDQQNPRFTPSKKPDGTGDDDIIRFIDRTADLSELTQSMAANGYIKIEPMVVLQCQGQLIVLEGNRRLAALKCLRGPKLARRAGVKLPKISSKNRASLDEVLIWCVEDRSSAQDLIGFKHINGPHSWDAYAKALFAMRWLEGERAKNSDLSLSDIAQKMGDRHDTLKRMVTAALVIRQADEDGIWSISDRKRKHFSFSHLYTGLSYSEFTDYLGMKCLSRFEDPVKAPVPKKRYRRLSQLLGWLYGNKIEDEEPIIHSQADDLKRLRRVLSNRAATHQLELTRKLDEAVTTATPRSELFARSVYQAEQGLSAALQNQSGFDTNYQSELVDTLKSIQNNVESLVLIIEKKGDGRGQSEVPIG